jgi:membrane protein implicated in regulation of membrane protease activity
MMENISTVVWGGIGLVLLIAEMLTLTFVLLFFGASAIVVALAKLLGLQNLPLELVIFALGGLGGIWLFRSKLVIAMQAKKVLQIDQETVIVLSNNVPANGRAELEYQGSRWTAMNESAVDLKAGQEAVIVRTEGVRLVVKPK